jgi:ligand-binding sensor domain-containing protein
LAVAPDGAIWVNGWEGLQGSQYVALLDGESWTAYRGNDSYPGGFVAHAVTSDGQLWGTIAERRLACFDGRSWTDGESWTFYDTADGLPSDEIVDLVVASDGVLWAITDGGIAYFENGGWEGIPLEQEPGTINTMACAPDGSIWLGGSKGALHLRP